MTYSLVATLVLALTLAVPAIARQDAVLLQVRPAVGQEYVWTAVMKTEAVNASGEFQLDMNLTQRVLSRTEQDLTWSMKTAVTQVSAKGVFAGIENVLRTVDGKEMTKVVDLTGQTTRLTLDGQDVPSSGTPDVTFPEKAVTPGESWVALSMQAPDARPTSATPSKAGPLPATHHHS